MPYCKTCGYELGSPETDLHDPEGLSDMAKDVLDGPNESEDAHLIVRDGKRGWRYYCDTTGQVTSIEMEPPDKETEEGEGGSPNDESNEPKEVGPVYEEPEQKTQKEILQEVVTNPSYGLNEGQMEEIKEWSEIYDNKLPPDQLQSVVSNFDGISKQTSVLMKRKYEAKLNKWLREQSKDNTGPPIGLPSPPPANPKGSSSKSSNKNRPSPKEQKESHTREMVEDVASNQRVDSSGMGSDRRSRRVKRRNDAADVAMEKVAEEAADEVARELAKNMGMGLGLIRKVLHAKAEKDPDWFLEKKQEIENSLGINVLEIMEPSDARKEEIQGGKASSPTPDSMIDSALDDMSSNGVEEQTDDQPAVKDEPKDEGKESGGLGELAIEQNQPTDDEGTDDEAFNEVFGSKETQG